MYNHRSLKHSQRKQYTNRKAIRLSKLSLEGNCDDKDYEWEGILIELTKNATETRQPT